jgi:hypothetical protein
MATNERRRALNQSQALDSRVVPEKLLHRVNRCRLVSRIVSVSFVHARVVFGKEFKLKLFASSFLLTFLCLPRNLFIIRRHPNALENFRPADFSERYAEQRYAVYLLNVLHFDAL